MKLSLLRPATCKKCLTVEHFGLNDGCRIADLFLLLRNGTMFAPLSLPPQEWQQSVRSAISRGIPSLSAITFVPFLSFPLFSCRPIWDKCTGLEIFVPPLFVIADFSNTVAGKLERRACF